MIILETIGKIIMILREFTGKHWFYLQLTQCPNIGSIYT